MDKKQEICRLALEMLFDSQRVFVKKGISNYVYRNPETGDEDACKIVGNRIVWRVEKSSFTKGHGRWRDDPKDEVILFRIKGSHVDISISERRKKETKSFKLK
jgi:hypothetical protein